MFKIYSDTEQILSVSGDNIDLDETEITIKKNAWTYLPYLPNSSMTVKSALADYEAQEGDVIKSNDGFAMYYGNEWIGSLTSLQPNMGYMFKSQSAASKTFKYPAYALHSSKVAVASKASNFESNMNIVAYAPEKAANDVVRAYVGNAENDVVEITLDDNYALQFVNVSAKNGDIVRFTLEHNGTTYEATNRMAYESDKVCGTPAEPVVLNFNIGGDSESLVTYPNPVVDVLNVAGAFSGEGDATVELLDVAGRVVYSGSVSVSDSAFKCTVNMAGLASGSYVLRVTQNNEVKTAKVVKN